MKELIAYRTKDLEGDIWSEVAFMFESREEVDNFFKEDNPELISLFTDEEDEEDRKLKKFKVFRTPNGEIINSVSFKTEYAGKVNIFKMYKGFATTKKPGQ